ncbi:hypothetical protein [Fusobacterium sp.]|uniref:hypothetical protein n=2 Tax=Fusobacterium TaxID=848 RepID=UPI0025C16115|nr:hypothetical protein [Fusobacterium sp.]MCI7223298.1 hypothetical protein [Fusobacterium sp.]
MSVEKNSYTVEEAAKLKGCNMQAIREQIKQNMIPGCTATKIGKKNYFYSIPKVAFDNHLNGVTATDVQNIKALVKEAVKEAWAELINAEVERRLLTQ